MSAVLPAGDLGGAESESRSFTLVRLQVVSGSAPGFLQLPSVELNSGAKGQWIHGQGPPNEFVVLPDDESIVVATDRRVWLLRAPGPCTDVQCHHGTCIDGVCHCQANFLGRNCTYEYGPLRGEWPLWIGLGAMLSLLLVVAICLLGMYKFQLWVKFRLQMLQLRQTMERRGYAISQDEEDRPIEAASQGAYSSLADEQ